MKRSPRSDSSAIISNLLLWDTFVFFVLIIDARLLLGGGIAGEGGVNILLGGGVNILLGGGGGVNILLAEAGGGSEMSLLEVQDYLISHDQRLSYFYRSLEIIIKDLLR